MIVYYIHYRDKIFLSTSIRKERKPKKFKILKIVKVSKKDLLEYKNLIGFPNTWYKNDNSKIA